jgi:hypothetical protein
MKNTNTLKALVLSTALLVTFSVSAQKAKKPEKNKFLEGKKYDVQFYEVKPTGRGKALPSNFLIKGGKVDSDLMLEKLSADPAPYKVVLDSTYTEDEVEMHMVKIEAESAVEKNEYKWEATIINYDVEGTVIQLKSGVEKKKYEFSGSEKVKK